MLDKETRAGIVAEAHSGSTGLLSLFRTSRFQFESRLQYPDFGPPHITGAGGAARSRQ